MRNALVFATAVILVSLGSHMAAALDTVRVDHHAVAVIDGDTIQVNGRVLQLDGIDAPELGQACDNGGHYWLCGISAAYELRRLIGLQVAPLECDVVGTDSTVARAQCMTAGFDIAVTLISSGLAIAAPDSPMHYRIAQRRAREAEVGIWAGPFIEPAKWRQDVRLPGEHRFTLASHLHGELPWKLKDGELSFEPRSEHAACLVKGVVEGDSHIFYGPLDSEYDHIQLNPKRGDRLFCGDDLARLAGWRHKGSKARVN